MSTNTEITEDTMDLTEGDEMDLADWEAFCRDEPAAEPRGRSDRWSADDEADHQATQQDLRSYLARL